MKRLFTCSALLSVLTAFSSVLSPGDALKRIDGGNVPLKVKGILTQKTPELSHTFEADGEAAVYVFNTGSRDGFLVVGADDAALPLLGYSDKGGFDLSSAPANLIGWMEGYARQIERARNTASPKYFEPAVGESETPKADVAPKLTTQWDQSKPYNDWCPIQNYKKSYTGCVATAVSQIMNWHRWPEKATGTKRYKPWYISGYLAIDYDTVRLAWDKMLPQVLPTSPYENREAVAALMQAVGYAAEMEYTSVESGALTYKAAAGLINHFGYNKGITVEKREWHSRSEWHDLVYNELTQNGPVYYDGAGDGGGHAFVCDGYLAEKDLYHFNWGWSGLSDGWFALEALAPDTQGAGGVSHDYSWDQSIITGFRKDEPGSQKTVKMATIAGVSTVWEKQKLGEFFTLMGYETGDGFGLYSVTDVDILFGTQYKNEETGKIYNSPQGFNKGAEDWSKPMKAYTRQQVLRFWLPDEMEEGKYRIYPVFKTSAEDEWHKMEGNPAFRQYIVGDVKGDSIFFSRGLQEAKLSVDILDIPDYFTSEGDFTIKCRINNIGTADFSGTYCGVFMNVDGALSVAGKGHSDFISLPAGESVELEYVSSVKEGQIVDGYYGFCIGNSTTGEIISDLYEALVGNRYGELKLTYFDLKIENQSYVDAGHVKATVSITCPQGVYDGPIYLLGDDTKRKWTPKYKIASEPYQFTAVETKEVVFDALFQEGVLGNMYYLVPGYKNADGEYIPMSDTYVPITVAQEAPESGIAGAEDSTASPAEYRTFQGILLKGKPDGIPYIEIRNGKAVKRR